MSKFLWGKGMLWILVILSIAIPRLVDAQNYPKRFYIHIDGWDVHGITNDKVPPLNETEMYDKGYTDAVVDYGINLLYVPSFMNQVGTANHRCVPIAPQVDPQRDFDPCGQCPNGLVPDRSYHVVDAPNLDFLDRIYNDYEGLIDVTIAVPELTESETQPKTWEGVPYTYNASDVDAALAYYDHPVIKGFYLGDEISRDDSPGIEAYENHIHPTGKWTLVNHYPTYASPTQLGFNTYDDFMQEMMSHPSPSIYSVDYYPIDGWVWPAASNTICTSKAGLFDFYDMLARKANSMPIPPPLYHYVQIVRDQHGTSDCSDIHPNNTSSAMPLFAINYQIYAGLIYGSKGFGYFRRDYPHGCTANSSTVLPYDWWNYISISDKLSLKDLHTKLDCHSEVLTNLTFEDCIHFSNSIGYPTALGPVVADLPPSANWSNLFNNNIAYSHLKYSSPFVVTPTTGSAQNLDNLVVSFLHDHKGGQYFWVFNKSTTEILDFEVQFQDSRFLLNVLEDEYCSLVGDAAPITLDPAEGKLFQIQDATPPSISCNGYTSGMQLSYLNDQLTLADPGCNVEFFNGSLGWIKTNATLIGEKFFAELGSDVTISSIEPVSYCGLSKRSDPDEDEVTEIETELLKIIPNPNAGSFDVEWQGAEDQMLEIYDMRGVLITKRPLQPGVQRVDLKSFGITAGVYFGRVDGKDRHLIKKILVQ